MGYTSTCGVVLSVQVGREGQHGWEARCTAESTLHSHPSAPGSQQEPRGRGLEEAGPATVR